MGLPFSIPPYIENGKEALEQSLQIECYSLDTECLGASLVDDAFWLEGYEASTSLFVIPKELNRPPTFADATFFADCIAFEHDFSAIAFPKSDVVGDDDVPWDVYSRHHEPPPGVRYIDWLREAAEVASRLNSGMECRAIFKYDWFHFDAPGDEIAKIAWTMMFESVPTAIHLYNAALRQIDPLTQYLCFYRAIESIVANNGKKWIESTLSGQMDYATPVWCLPSSKPLEDLISPALKPLLRNDRLIGEEDRFNVLEVTRAKAQYRLESLRRGSSDDQIANRLYNENRCGIAHGSRIRRHDLGDDFLAVLQDVPLIRYLARIAIESQIK